MGATVCRNGDMLSGKIQLCFSYTAILHKAVSSSLIVSDLSLDRFAESISISPVR